MSARAQTQTSAQPVPAINAVSVGFLQRKCGCGSHTIAGEECSECRQKSGLLQRQAVNATQSPIPPIVPEVLSSPAHSLDPATRSFMEPRFGRDFSHVRVHTDAKASESAKAVGALAYTVGNDVVFAAGRYSPSTQDGRRLIAHELTHTLQQRGAPLQTALEVGRIDDPGEVEADRVAAAVMGSGSVPGVNAGPAGVLRRAPDEPKPLRTDIAHVPVSTTSEEKVHVIRKMMPCECRKVPDVREGVFYNPNLNALAIAYRHCSGGTRTDVYAEVQSNLSSFLAGGPPPTGTGRIGFEINVVGKKVGAKATLEVTGSNVTGGQGVGGRAQVVFQGDKWRVFVTSNFLHGLGANSGDVLDLNLGGRLGPITAELQVQNLLTPSPTTTGDVCADLPGTSIRACFEIFGSGGVGAGLKGPLGGPQRDRDECFQCLCPPPTKHYTCYHDVPPTEKQVEREIEVQVPHEHRFYFALDHKSAPSEDKTLTSQGETNLGNVEKDVKAGGSVVMVTGYASPEAKEGHNADLSMGRAKTIVERLRTKLPGTTIPEPIGGGEVLGRRPKAVPSSKLGEAFQGAGFRSAEEMSFLLLGEEILEPDLADQFVSLFNKITDPADRLAIFGLDANSPIKEKVLKTVDEFMRKPHAGSRPWENVFRLLRVAVVRTSIPEKQKITETERTSDSIDVLGEAACELQAEKAEQAGLLPPVPEELRTSNRSREDREAECLIEVKPADRRTGCDYTVTEDMKLRPHAPPRAPRPLF